MCLLFTMVKVSISEHVSVEYGGSSYVVLHLLKSKVGNTEFYPPLYLYMWKIFDWLIN